jgi:hypothetical protein
LADVGGCEESNVGRLSVNETIDLYATGNLGTEGNEKRIEDAAVKAFIARGKLRWSNSCCGALKKNAQTKPGREILSMGKEDMAPVDLRNRNKQSIGVGMGPV